MQPVTVIQRNDSNYDTVVAQVADSITRYSRLPEEEKTTLRKKAMMLARKADWKHFFFHYRRAYAFAINQTHKQPFYTPTIPNLF